jgi:hypothetical protein
VTREEFDRRELELLGRVLDFHAPMLRGWTTAQFLAWALLKVRGKNGKLQRLKANAMQRAYERYRGQRNIVLKARQMGMTTWLAGRFLLKTITKPGTLTLQVAHTREAAQELLQIVHRFVDNLPEGLKRGALQRSKSNVRQIVFPKIDSEYRVVSAADRNAGRGMTYQNLHCSEVARWAEDADEILAGLMAGLAPGGELVLESTPHGVGGCFYDQWQRAVDPTQGERGEGDGRMIRHFFPWWLEAGYRAAAVEEPALSVEERALMERHGLTLEQIGYRRVLQSGFQQLVRQEYVEDAEKCFLASGEPYFEMEAVGRCLEQAPLGPLRRRHNGQLEVWMPPMPDRRYVVAVDPAGGGSEGDYSAIEVLDLESGLQCAEFAGHVTGLELMELARELAWDHHTAHLVVERNNHGAGLLWLLAEKGYRNVYKGPDGQPGLLTTALNRPQILARMSAVLVESPEIFQSRKLLAECRTFVRLRNGGMGARSGAHDDRVMAMALGLAARAELLGTRLGARD